MQKIEKFLKRIENLMFYLRMGNFTKEIGNVLLKRCTAAPKKVWVG